MHHQFAFHHRTSQHQIGLAERICIVKNARVKRFAVHVLSIYSGKIAADGRFSLQFTTMSQTKRLRMCLFSAAMSMYACGMQYIFSFAQCGKACNFGQNEMRKKPNFNSVSYKVAGNV